MPDPDLKIPLRGHTRSDVQEVTLSHGGTVRGQPDAVALAVAIDQKFQNEERNWVAQLRAMGVKAAHPDDGWVHRTDDPCVHLEYPQFNDGPEVGDLIALGWPWKPQWRLVRVTRIELTSPMFGLRHFYFDEVARFGEEVARFGEEPTPPPKRTLWERLRRKDRA